MHGCRASVIRICADSAMELSPAFYPSAFSRNELIVYYSLRGLPIADIRHLLADVHAHVVSTRHLIRLRTALNVGRRSQRESELSQVVTAIQRELTTSGSLLGYRAMWNRLNTTYGLSVRRDTVMMLLSVFDPCGTESRKKRRIRRRTYHSKGPNYIWHMDGYDKLKPYGITIHGCIDGYSRRIMWAHVAYSNNNPNFIAQYYMDCIENVRGCPTMIRADRGTENSIVAFLQPAFRHHHFDNLARERSFQYGRSSANQRIEAWWSYLRSHMTDWWIDYFKDLQVNGYFDNTLQHHVDAIRYSFGPIIQKQLSDLVMEWNHHRIRNNSTAEAPGGIPEILYHLPSASGAVDCKCPIDDALLYDAKEDYGHSAQGLLVDEAYRVYADRVCTEFGIHYPAATHEDALFIFLVLKDDSDFLNQ